MRVRLWPSSPASCSLSHFASDHRGPHRQHWQRRIQSDPLRETRRRRPRLPHQPRTRCRFPLTPQGLGVNNPVADNGHQRRPPEEPSSRDHRLRRSDRNADRRQEPAIIRKQKRHRDTAIATGRRMRLGSRGSTRLTVGGSLGLPNRIIRATCVASMGVMKSSTSAWLAPDVTVSR